MATVTSVLEGMRVKSTKTVLVVLRLTSTSAGASASGDQVTCGGATRRKPLGTASVSVAV